ncbi:tetratricopeptide repeat protein, partial [Thermodesulfobacteriota bacterium]
LYELHPLVRQFVRSEFPHSERRHFIKLLSASYQEFVVLIRDQTDRNFLLAIDKFECAAMSIELEMQAKNYDRAVEIANEIRDAFLWRGLGEEYLRVCGEIIELINWSNDSLVSNSEFHQFVRDLIEVMGDYGRKSAAQDIIEKYNRFALKGTTVYLAWCKTLCHYNWLTKDYKNAIKWGEEGARLKRESDIDTDIDHLHSLNLAKRDIGQINEALVFFSQGQNVDEILVTDQKQRENNAPFFGNIGRCVHLLGNAEKALQFYIRSAKILGREQKNAENLMNLGWASLWIGQACIDLQDWENARLFLSQCLDIWQKRAPLQLELFMEQKMRFPDHFVFSPLEHQELTHEKCRKQIEEWQKSPNQPINSDGKNVCGLAV